MEIFVKYIAVVIAGMSAMIATLEKIGNRIQGVFNLLALTITGLFFTLMSSSLIFALYLFNFEKWQLPGLFHGFWPKFYESFFSQEYLISNLAGLLLVFFFFLLLFSWKKIGYKLFEHLTLVIAEDVYTDECTRQI